MMIMLKTVRVTVTMTLAMTVAMLVAMSMAMKMIIMMIMASIMVIFFERESPTSFKSIMSLKHIHSVYI